MVSTFSRKRNNLGVRYGFIAGLFFTLVAWGLDALILARYHAALPFLKFLPALLVCVPAATLAGYLTAKSENGLLGLVIWGALAVLFTFLVVNIPTKFFPWYLSKIRPDFIPIIHFEELIGLGGYWFYCLFAIGITCMLCGFLENVLIDQGLASSSLVGPYTPLIICAMFMLLAGLFGDLLMTRDFRKSVVQYDQLLTNAAIYHNQEVDVRTKRELRLGTAEPLGDLVLEPHTLILVEIDRYLSLTKILIEFDGQAALCQAIHAQPTFCKMIDLTQQKSGNLNPGSQKKIGVDSNIDDIITFSNFPQTLTT